jgi:energy-coupling factor transporter ATP-binding protein EcfA2
MTGRLSSIELEAFRGFADAQRFDLDADVVLVRGDNGSGKTLLIDGLLWVLTGEIPRLTERARGLRRGHDPIVNLYAGAPARVRISLVGPDGRMLDFERRGTSVKHALSAWDGDQSLRDAEEELAHAFGDLSSAALSEAVKTWGILQQHAVSAALDGGATMHERLSSILGLERVTLFAASATRTAKDLGKECKRLQGVHADLLRRAEEAVQQAPLQVQLASAAIELLGDACPVCCQAIDEAHVRSQLTGLIAQAQPDQAGQIDRLSADTKSLFGEVARARREIDDAEARYERARALEKATKQAAERVVRRWVAKLESSFAEVFDRLAPHPTFTELRATQDIYYSRNQIVPEVVDADQQLTANPALLFSEGQLNVVALSYFLGLALNAREGALPFLVLDDPLQAMDVRGVLGFADLCCRIREHRQLVLSTHDRRYASLLQRKLAPREADARTVSYEFEGWTRSGPKVNTTIEPLAEVLPLLRQRAS